MTHVAGPELSPIEKIKAQHRAIRDALHRPACTSFVVPEHVRAGQIGLHAVMVDEIGRLWRVDCSPIIMVFDPLRRAAPQTAPGGTGKTEE